MDLSRDQVKNFCKTHGLGGYGKESKKPKPEKVIRENCKKCGNQINQKKLKGLPKTYCSAECKKDWKQKTQSYIGTYVIIVGQSLRIEQRIVITVPADVTFEIGFGEMKIQMNITDF